MISYTAAYESMIALGIPRDKAMRAALVHATPAERAAMDKEAKRSASIREKEEQAAITKLFREHGFTVRSTSQSRPSKVVLGLPDLWVTHKTKPLAFWFEVKRQVGGVLSEMQEEFGADCIRCGVRWYKGDRYDAMELLRQEGL